MLTETCMTCVEGQGTFSKPCMRGFEARPQLLIPSHQENSLPSRALKELRVSSFPFYHPASFWSLLVQSYILPLLLKPIVNMRGFYSALVACALILNVTVALKLPRFRDVSRRGQDKANKAVREATRMRLDARQTNTSTDAPLRYLSDATASKYISVYILYP